MGNSGRQVTIFTVYRLPFLEIPEKIFFSSVKPAKLNFCSCSALRISSAMGDLFDDDDAGGAPVAGADPRFDKTTKRTIHRPVLGHKYPLPCRNLRNGFTQLTTILPFYNGHCKRVEWFHSIDHKCGSSVTLTQTFTLHHSKLLQWSL